MQFEIKEEKNIIFFIKSELTLTNHKVTREEFNKIITKNKNVTIDLTDCDYIDSSGIGELISLNKKILDKGNNLIIININKKIRSILEMCSLKSFIKVEDDGS